MSPFVTGPTLAVAAGVAIAMRPEHSASVFMWTVLLVTYAVCTVVALVRLSRTGKLRGLLAFRPGDTSVGILVGAVLLAGFWLFRTRVIPVDAPQAGWLFRIYMQIGDVQRPMGLMLALFAIVLMEEIVWRGLVLSELSDSVGPRRAWLVATALYAAAHLPTLVTLADTDAGPNPLLVLAALGAGSFWSFMTSRTERLLPAITAHAVFSYFVITWPL